MRSIVRRSTGACSTTREAEISNERRAGTRLLVLLGATIMALGATASAAAAAAPKPGALQLAFARAAHEFGVPESVLLAIAY